MIVAVQVLIRILDDTADKSVQANRTKRIQLLWMTPTVQDIVCDFVDGF